MSNSCRSDATNATDVEKSNKLIIQRHIEACLLKREVHALRLLHDSEFASYKQAFAVESDNDILHWHTIAMERLKHTEMTLFCGLMIPINEKKSYYNIVRHYEAIALLYNLFETGAPLNLVTAKVADAPALSRFLRHHHPDAHSVRVDASFATQPDEAQVPVGENTAKAFLLTELQCMKDELSYAERARLRVIKLADKHGKALDEMLTALKCEYTQKRKRTGERVQEAQKVNLSAVHYRRSPIGMGAMGDGTSDAARIVSRRGDEDDGTFGAHAMQVLGSFICSASRERCSSVLPYGNAPKFSSGAKTEVVDHQVRYVDERGRPTCDNSVTLKLGDDDSEKGTSLKADYLAMQQAAYDFNHRMLKIQKIVNRCCRVEMKIMDSDGAETKSVPVLQWHDDVKHALGVACYLPQISRKAEQDDDEKDEEDDEDEEKEEEDDDDDDDEEYLEDDEEDDEEESSEEEESSGEESSDEESSDEESSDEESSGEDA